MVMTSATTVIVVVVIGVPRQMVVWTLGKLLITLSSLLVTQAHLRRGPPGDRNDDREAAARNPGSNLFVTGIHPRLTEADVSRLFEKYGDVEGCSIMKDPHTQESRGFGFVKMITAEQADAAKEGLQGENIEGRTLSIEKARRARPRTPTPGKYFGPPKRGMCRLASLLHQGSLLMSSRRFSRASTWRTLRRRLRSL